MSQSVYITAANPQGFPLGSIQAVSDQLALGLIGANQALLAGTVTALATSVQERNKIAAASARQATVVIAAYNSVGGGADVYCTGVNDDIAINNAIAELPFGGGTIFFRSGTYNLSNPVVIDRSWVTLQGENHPMWLAYLTSWTGAGNAGSVGPVCAHLNQTNATVGSNHGVVIANNNVPDQGENRHRGICVKDLYITGNNYASGSVGILANSSAHDFCRFENNCIQKFITGINDSCDSPFIFNNSLQDIYGVGINHLGPNARITHNLIFDIAGAGIVAAGGNTIYALNKIGDIAGDAVSVQCYGSVFSGNQVGGVNGHAFNIQWSGNTFTGNTIDYKTTSFGKASRSGGAFYLASGTDGAQPYGANSITGNTILASSTVSESAGVYAIDGASTAGNCVQGNCIRGLWNNSGTAVNASLTGGTNVVGNNPTS